MLTVVLVILVVACGIFKWCQRNNKEEPPAFHGAFPLLGHAHLLVGDCKLRRIRLIMLTAVLVLVVVFLICALLALARRDSSKDEPPALPGALPLIGHSHLLLGANSLKLWDFFKDVSYESLKAGGVLSVSMGPKTVYFVTDPNDFLKIANACLEKDKIYQLARPWVGDGLVTSQTSLWKVHRKRMNSAFSQVVLDGYQDVFNAQSRRLIQNLEAEVGTGPFNHLIYTACNAVETLCLTAFGADFRDQTHILKEYVHATEEILEIIIKRFLTIWLHSDCIFYWSELKRKQDKCLKTLHGISDTVFRNRKANYLKNRKLKTIDDISKGPLFKPLMDLLLELSIEEGFLNDQEIKDHVDTFFFAGHDTLAGVLMFTMLLVGSYPTVQDEICNELQRIFGDEDRDVTKQDLSQLMYLEAVIKESMRLYPVAPLVIRQLDSDIKLRTCTLTKGRTCFLMVYGVHRHPMWGPDAEQFKPERWLDPATFCDSTIMPFAAFSMGRRSCIGQTFSYMSMKTTLVHVFRHYKVTGDHTKMVTKFEILLKSCSGHHIAIEKRKK